MGRRIEGINRARELQEGPDNLAHGNPGAERDKCLDIENYVR